MQVNNPRWPHHCVIRDVVAGPAFSGDGVTSSVVYDGICRSYTKLATKGTGEVITSNRVLSIPLTTFDWERAPKAGDLVEVEAGSVTEYGEVVDCNPNNFGTDVNWRYVRN